MPKRIIKTKRDFDCGFAHGFAAAKNHIFLCMQFMKMRSDKNMTIEEFATGADVPIWFIKGMEETDYNTYLKSDLGYFTKVANFCNVSISVGIKAVLDNSVNLNTVRVKTFDEEIEELKQIKINELNSLDWDCSNPNNHVSIYKDKIIKISAFRNLDETVYRYQPSVNGALILIDGLICQHKTTFEEAKEVIFNYLIENNV